jgi:hypothetical protein
MLPITKEAPNFLELRACELRRIPLLRLSDKSLETRERLSLVARERRNGASCFVLALLTDPNEAHLELSDSFYAHSGE